MRTALAVPVIGIFFIYRYGIDIVQVLPSAFGGLNVQTVELKLKGSVAATPVSLIYADDKFLVYGEPAGSDLRLTRRVPWDRVDSLTKRRD